MTVLVADDLGPDAVGGAALRVRALAAGLAGEDDTHVIDMGRMRRAAGCATGCATAGEGCGGGSADDPYRAQWCARAARAVVARVRALAPQPVIVSHLKLHGVFTALCDAGVDRLAIDLHNIESDLYAEIGAHPLAARTGATTPAEVAALRKIEASVISRADAVCVTSAVDAARVAAQHPLAPVHVVPNAVHVPSRAPDLTAPPSRDGPHLLFLGALSYFPNLHAALRLAQEIYPLIRRVLPQATLTVAGHRPPAMLRDVMDRCPADLVADPTDTGPLLRGRVLLVPLSFGGGTRLKVLEAFAHGVPVVSSTKGIEGIDAIHDVHYLRADPPAAFAAQLLRLRADPSADVQRRRAAFELVSQRYSDAAVTDCLRRALAGLSAAPGRHRGRGTRP